MLKTDGVDIPPNFMLGNYIGDINNLIKTADIELMQEYLHNKR